MAGNDAKRSKQIDQERAARSTPIAHREHKPIEWAARTANPEGAARMDAARALSAREQADRDAAAQRDDGMQRVEQHASAKWKIEAWDFLHAYLADNREMFVDDLWEAGLPHTHDDRALGPLFARAARNGFMRKTGEFRPSNRSNLTEKPVWLSLIYRLT